MKNHGRRKWRKRRGGPLWVARLTRGTLGERAADAIRARIVAGGVRPGQRLESMRALAVELGISLATVREAIAELRGAGLVTVRHGVGTYVARRLHQARTVKAARRRAIRREAAELRPVVDAAVARIAAARGDDELITDLRFALGERERARLAGEPDAFVDADLELHLALGRASRNSVGIGLHRLAMGVLDSGLRARATDDQLNRHLTDLHRALVDAVDEGRQRAAERAARAIAEIESRPP